MLGRFTKVASRFWLCIAVSTVIACNLPASTWRSRGNEAKESKVQRIGDVPARDSWYKLQFINEQEGWLASGKKLWHSIDGGKSWKPCSPINGASGALDIAAFEFIDSQTGWILASSYIYKTEDGGSTWRRLVVSISEPVLRSIKFFKDGKRGWAAGEMYLPISRKDAAAFPSQLLSADGKEGLYPALFYTEDGGATWYQQHLPSAEGRLLHMYFLDADHGWASSDGGVFYLESGSNRWKIVDYSKSRCDKEMLMETTQWDREGGDAYEPVAIYFLDANQGWLSFRNGYMAHSADGGRSWCDLLNPRGVWPNPSWSTFFQKIHFADSMRGWGLSGDGYLHETTDGGATWQRINVEARFEDIYFLDNGSGLAVAEQGLFRIGS